MKNSKKQKLFDGDLENTLYWLSIFIIIFVGIIYFAQVYFVNYINRPDLMECSLKRMCNIPCPGCGGTRAIISLLKGNVLQSIYYNAFAAYACIVYAIFFITQTLQRITAGKIHGMKYRNMYLWIGIAVLIIQYILKLVIPVYTI